MPDSLFNPDLDSNALDQLFRKARTYNAFDGEVSDDLLRRIYDLMKFGPTSANQSPARFVFLKSSEARKKLEPALSEGNRAKTMAAPMVVIIAHDLDFHEKLPYLFPHTDAKPWFEDLDTRKENAFRNGSLQGAYFLIAARALGLDCGPMTGFDHAMVNEIFFKGTQFKSNFLVNLGHGDPGSIFPRSPRLGFDEACRIE